VCIVEVEKLKTIPQLLVKTNIRHEFEHEQNAWAFIVVKTTNADCSHVLARAERWFRAWLDKSKIA
jgi:hypothetical protein